MHRKIVLVVALAGLMLAASGMAQVGDRKETESFGWWYPWSPVGAWTIQYVDDVSPDGNNTVLQQYNLGGTMTGLAWTDTQTNTVGNWKKIGRNRYISTFYVMIPVTDPEGGGYLKQIEEFWMVGRDEMEGRLEGWWVSGMDPLGEAVGPFWTGSNFYNRISAEPKQVP